MAPGTVRKCHRIISNDRVHLHLGRCSRREGHASLCYTDYSPIARVNPEGRSGQVWIGHVPPDGCPGRLLFRETAFPSSPGQHVACRIISSISWPNTKPPSSNLVVCSRNIRVTTRMRSLFEN